MRGKVRLGMHVDPLINMGGATDHHDTVVIRSDVDGRRDGSAVEVVGNRIGVADGRRAGEPACRWRSDAGLVERAVFKVGLRRRRPGARGRINDGVGLCGR